MQPAGGQGEQFGGGAQVPVGVGRTPVPQEGGQDGCVRLNIDAVAIPAQVGVDGEGVPEIMNAGTASSGRRVDAGPVQKLPERLAGKVGCIDRPVQVMKNDVPCGTGQSWSRRAT